MIDKQDNSTTAMQPFPAVLLQRGGSPRIIQCTQHPAASRHTHMQTWAHAQG